MLDSLTKRFSKAEETKILILATSLDPRYKAGAFASEETQTMAKRGSWRPFNAQRKRSMPSTRRTWAGWVFRSRNKEAEIHQPILVDTPYARVLGATAVSCCLYSFETELECYLSEHVIERSACLCSSGRNIKQDLKHLHIWEKNSCAPTIHWACSVFCDVGMLYDARRSWLTLTGLVNFLLFHKFKCVVYFLFHFECMALSEIAY